MIVILLLTLSAIGYSELVSGQSDRPTTRPAETNKLREVFSMPKVATPTISAQAAEDPCANPAFGITGTYGGPFNPASFQFNIVNQAHISMYWHISEKPDYVTMTPMSGYIGPGQQYTGVATLNTLSNSIPVGQHCAIMRANFAPQFGDFNGDHKVNSEDMEWFQGCRTGPTVVTTVSCSGCDMDYDGDVDQDDFGILQRCLSGDEQALQNCHTRAN
jgi:hypothetical protein